MFTIELKGVYFYFNKNAFLRAILNYIASFSTYKQKMCGNPWVLDESNTYKTKHYVPAFLI